MNNLKQLLEETRPTAEQYKIHKQVQKHYYLDDLQYLLDEMLEENEITQEEYDLACQEAKIIIEKYDKWLDYDWRNTMKEAIKYVL